MSGSEEESESDEDAMDDGEAPAARVTRSGKAAQNAQLYGQKGQFNPHAARAEKKRAKKIGGGLSHGVDSDSDFDFEDDFEDAKHDNAFAQLADGSESDEEEEEEEEKGIEGME